ncbi:MAG TPA: right-handed parallel beta-helix repeat-containing protein, partial [Candidatus Binatia bacterium]|nr:right-handed parallel beta-helix repeat-containing protein [Candidatus Binatia bacterium]
MTWKAARLLCLALLLGALGVLVGASPATAAGVTRYVVSSGDDTDNDCTDPANPCQHLQYAIDQANDGDTIAVGGTVASNVTVRTSLTITQWSGQAPAVLDGGSNDTVVKVDGTGAVTPPSVTLSDLTIQNGAALGFLQSAGGVYNNATLDVENTTISGNLADNQGGGIYNDTGGTLTVANSTVSNNSATNGGGLANASGASLTLESSTVSDNSAFNAGGAFLDFGTATILRSTIAGNSAPHQGGGINVQPGAATLLVAESTLTGNVGGIGGAFWNQGTLTVESSTITANSSGIGTQASATFAGDIIAGQNGPDCEGPDPGPPLLVAIADAGYNVDDDGTCGLSAANHSISDSSAIDSYLGGLADNGGPTETQALLNTPSPATSATDPALGAVPPSFDLPEAVDGHTALCSVADQRGITPAAGLNCDIGAYLLQPTATSLSASSATIAQGGSVTYTATVFPAPDGGTVTFSDGAGNPATTHCAAQPLTGGTATCTVSYPAAGGFAVSATYSGDGASNN